MRRVPARIREEPEDREGEGEWIIAAAETVINPVFFRQFNQIAEKRLTKWYSGEGVEIIVAETKPFKASNPIEFYVRVAEGK